MKKRETWLAVKADRSDSWRHTDIERNAIFRAWRSAFDWMTLRCGALASPAEECRKLPNTRTHDSAGRHRDFSFRSGSRLKSIGRHIVRLIYMFFIDAHIYTLWIEFLEFNCDSTSENWHRTDKKCSYWNGWNMRNEIRVRFIRRGKIKSSEWDRWTGRFEKGKKKKKILANSRLISGVEQEILLYITNGFSTRKCPLPTICLPQ